MIDPRLNDFKIKKPTEEKSYLVVSGDLYLIAAWNNFEKRFNFTYNGITFQIVVSYWMELPECKPEPTRIVCKDEPIPELTTPDNLDWDIHFPPPRKEKDL